MKLTKKLLPLAGIACVTAAAVPAIASCSCGKEEKAKAEIVSKDVLGTKICNAGDDKFNMKTNAVYTVKLDKDFDKEVTVGIEELEIDSVDVKGDAAAYVEVDPDDAKKLYVVIPLVEYKTGATEIPDNVSATISFGLTFNKKFANIEKTDYTFKLTPKPLNVFIDDYTGFTLNLTGSVKAGSKDVVIQGLSLSNTEGTPSCATFDGKIYIQKSFKLTDTDDEDVTITNGEWSTLEAYGTDKQDLQFHGELSEAASAEHDGCVFTLDAGTKAEKIQIMFIPNAANQCPFYSILKWGGTEAGHCVGASLTLDVQN